MDRVKQGAVKGVGRAYASRLYQLPLDLGSVLQSSIRPETEDQIQAVQMFKTWSSTKWIISCLMAEMLDIHRWEKTTATKTNSWEDITAIVKAIKCYAEQQHFCAPGK